MNGFKIKKVKSLTLGEKMKKARNDKRITLSEISRNTKIQIEYLESLESGDYKQLPADVYVKGFLKSFAEYVGVNEEYLIKSFNKEKSIQKNIQGNEKRDITKNNNINLSRFYISPKIVSIVLISLFFIGLSFYLYKNLDNFVSNPSLVILNPENNTIINSSSVVVSGKTDLGNSLFINNQSVVVDENGGFSENIILRDGINIITVKSVNQFDKETVESISVEAHYGNNSEQIQAPQDNVEGGNLEPQAEQGVENSENNDGVNLNQQTEESSVLGAETNADNKVEEKDVEKKKKKK